MVKTEKGNGKKGYSERKRNGMGGGGGEENEMLKEGNSDRNGIGKREMEWEGKRKTDRKGTEKRWI